MNAAGTALCRRWLSQTIRSRARALSSTNMPEGSAFGRAPVIRGTADGAWPSSLGSAIVHPYPGGRWWPGGVLRAGRPRSISLSAMADIREIADGARGVAAEQRRFSAAVSVTKLTYAARVHGRHRPSRRVAAIDAPSAAADRCSQRSERATCFRS